MHIGFEPAKRVVIYTLYRTKSLFYTKKTPKVKVSVICPNMWITQQYQVRKTYCGCCELRINCDETWFEKFCKWLILAGIIIAHPAGPPTLFNLLVEFGFTVGKPVLLYHCPDTLQVDISRLTARR